MYYTSRTRGEILYNGLHCELRTDQKGNYVWVRCDVGSRDDRIGLVAYPRTAILDAAPPPGADLSSDCGA